MREQINNNPMVQLGLIAVLAIAAALMLLRGGGGDEAPAEPAATTPATGSTAAPVAGADPAAPEAVPPAAATPETATPPARMVPGRGLPKSFVKAYADNQVVVLLIQKKDAIDDRVLRLVVDRALAGRADVKLFVEQPKDIARFSQVTQGVEVDRVPALIVVKPRSRTDNTPVASVNYGFRGPKSVATAIEDALYEGGQRTAAP